MAKPIVLTLIVVLGPIICSKVAILSYNTAGIFRRFSDGTPGLNSFRKILIDDLKKESANTAELIIIAYQEIWDVSNTLKEAMSKFVDIFRPSLGQRVLKLSMEIMKEVFNHNKFECSGIQNVSLMTVACKLTNGAKIGSFHTKAFEQGWRENGGKTSTFILGFKGILGTKIDVQGKTILLVNLHLSSKKYEDRKKAINKIKELAKSDPKFNKFIFIMVGDFNARSFSLVLPNPKSFNDYKHNIGAAFLMLCLTKTLTNDSFKNQNTGDVNCDKLYELAKEYDDISFTLKYDFPEMREVKNLDFEPTFCFNFHVAVGINNHRRLCPKANEVVPSYTDRIFHLPNNDHKINWIRYTSIEHEGTEPSDHIPILGIFEITGSSDTNSDFTSIIEENSSFRLNAATFDNDQEINQRTQAIDLEDISLKYLDTVQVDEDDYDLDYLSDEADRDWEKAMKAMSNDQEDLIPNSDIRERSHAIVDNPERTSAVSKKFEFSPYAFQNIDYNKMVDGLSFKHISDFLSSAAKKFKLLEKAEVNKKRRII